jgi:hypothetical protein
MLRSFLSHTIKSTMPGFILFGCASMASLTYIVPPLKDRTLRISIDKPALIYHYRVPYDCGVLGMLTCYHDKTDEYDLTDPAVRKHLIEVGFVVKRRDP